MIFINLLVTNICNVLYIFIYIYRSMTCIVFLDSSLINICYEFYLSNLDLCVFFIFIDDKFNKF